MEVNRHRRRPCSRHPTLKVMTGIPDLDQGIREVAARLRSSPRITVLTGAGISVASGIPTFPDSGGLLEGVRPEEVPTPQAFARDPRFVWEWYEVRRRRSLECAPNRGHEVLAAWSRRFEG